MKRVVTLMVEESELKIDIDSSFFASSSFYSDEVVFLRWDDGSVWDSIVIVINESYVEKIREDYRYNQHPYAGCPVVVSSDAVKKLTDIILLMKKKKLN